MTGCHFWNGWELSSRVGCEEDGELEMRERTSRKNSNGVILCEHYNISTSSAISDMQMIHQELIETSWRMNSQTREIGHLVTLVLRQFT